ncbi:MAG: sulfatase [Candidatus Altiarchaeota archaeon]|nr:sulfatase [Candidatus Altiarchaeota archaeon]
MNKVHGNKIAIYIFIVFAIVAVAVAGYMLYDGTSDTREKSEIQADPTIYSCPDCNVVFISIDTLSAKHLGCYGYFRNTTPFIDELSAESLLFKNAYTNSPNTMISHASIITSHSPLSHGAIVPYGRHDGKPIPYGVKTMAEYYQENGFNTFGLTAHPGWLNNEYGFSRGMNEFLAIDENAEEHNKIVFKWLDTNNSSKFFLFLHYYDVHSDFKDFPYVTYTKYDEAFTNEYSGSFTGCYNGSCASDYLAQLDRGVVPPLVTEDINYLTARYDGQIPYVDEQIKQLIEKLNAVGVYDKTLIVITADHGEELAEHGGYLHNKIYEEIAHVPLIMHFPNGIGRTEDALVESLDILPTVLDFSDINYSDVQGTSLIRGEIPAKKIYSGYCFSGQTCPTLSVRNETTTVYSKDLKSFGVYSRVDDIGEHNNLIAEYLPPKHYADEFRGYIDEQLELNRKIEDSSVLVKASNETIEKLKKLGYVT